MKLFALLIIITVMRYLLIALLLIPVFFYAIAKQTFIKSMQPPVWVRAFHIVTVQVFEVLHYVYFHIETLLYCIYIFIYYIYFFFVRTNMRRKFRLQFSIWLVYNWRGSCILYLYVGIWWITVLSTYVLYVFFSSLCFRGYFLFFHQFW